MNSKNQKLLKIIELANNYPSPHNGQPIKLHAEDDTTLTLYFETSRGLTATPISYLFSFVTIGVFVRHFEWCAKALGHEVSVELELPKQEAMAQQTKLKCAVLKLKYDVHSPDQALRKIIQSRQTSRKKYSSGLDGTEQKAAMDIARSYGLGGEFLDRSKTHEVIWLNQRAVFDDMFNPPVRKELDHWLRYSDAEKHTKKDGLAYDCMELSGGALHFAVKYYKILHWPVIAPLLKAYYLRTMRDDSSVGYLTSAFETEQQSYDIGRCVIDIWLELTRSGKYLHPFGTIVSNETAHADFTKLIGLQNENRDDNYVVFIFRSGASPLPVESDRLPVAQHLYNQEQI